MLRLNSLHLMPRLLLSILLSMIRNHRFTLTARAAWTRWITSNWNRFAKRAHVRVPHWLPHPSRASLKKLSVALPTGQIADWSLPLSDGSRIHVQEMIDGSLVAHRDLHDPDVGLSQALAHGFCDTPIVAFSLVVAVVCALKLAARSS